MNSTIALVTQNGTDKYVKVTSSGTTAGTGVFPIGGTFPVNAGEVYRIRVKGYRTGTNPAYILIKTSGISQGWPGATLASTVATEAWTEQYVTIPTGSTTLQAGVEWNTVASGEIMYINEFEITKIGSGTPEYQYHLKDHLGNVRTTFTTVQSTDQTTGTYEPANQALEQSQYVRYSNAKLINATLFNHTTAGSYSERLNGSTNEKYGLAKSISVMPGDVISAEVYAKYVDPVSSNWTPALTTLMSQIAAGTAGVVIDGANYSTSTSSFPFAGLLSTTGSTGGPKAYLNWIIFDRNYVMITGGYQRLSAAPKETGNNVAHERLFSPNINITQPGYVYIYLSNEETTSVEVYFDDFKVTQTKSPLVSQQDYYPFGLNFNTFNRENNLPNDYKYNSKEEQTELGLLWLDYGARMYMPDIGRWPRIDPKAELYFQISPYAYAANIPTNAIDPDGRLVIFINGQQGGTGGKVDYWQKKEMVTRYTSVSFFGQEVWSGNERREEVTADFASKVQDHFNDHSPARFYDGAIGGWGNTFESTFVPQADNLSSGDRYAMGKREGEKDAADIIRSLDRTGGTLESIKVVSHSMGGAYAKGFVQAIVNYAMAHPEECKGLKISQYDFDPLQAAQLRAIPGVHTEQYSHIKKAGRKGSMGWLANGKQAGLDDEQGAKDGNTYREDPSEASHGIMSFINDILRLEEGKYVLNNGRWVKQ